MRIIDELYHGTPNATNQLVPKFNRRTQNSITIWAGEGVFATRDRRIAMLYTFKRNQYVTQGVNLIDEIGAREPVVLYLIGGNSQEEALEILFGTKQSSLAYIHRLNPTTFSREPGLGAMELVSRVAPTYSKCKKIPTGIEAVNPRLEIQKYIHEGLMRIDWKSSSVNS